MGLVIFFAIRSEYFLQPRNLLNIGDSVAITGTIAAGLTFLLVAGIVDLSVGAVMALTSVIVVQLGSMTTLPMVVIVLVALAACVGVSLVNAILIVRIGINSIIATLASATVITGLALILASGAVIPLRETAMQDLVTSRPFGIPAPLILMGVVYVIGYIFLTRTRTGWHVYAVGGNPSAAERAGLRPARIYVGLLIVASLLAGISAIIVTGQLDSGSGNLGRGREIDVLTACLLGGIGLQGGEGRIQRTLAGVLLIGVLNNGLTLMNVDSFVQEIARGLVFVLAVILDAVRRKKLAR